MARKLVFAEKSIFSGNTFALPFSATSGIGLDDEEIVQIKLEDLRRIAEEWSGFTVDQKRFLIFGTGFGENGFRYENGIFTEVLLKITNKNDISGLLLKAFIFGLIEFSETYKGRDYFDTIFEQLEEEILNLVLLQRYKFDNFDLLVTEKLNEYFSFMFSGNEPVDNLNIVYKTSQQDLVKMVLGTKTEFSQRFY